MQRRQEECTAAISTSALKESEGPSYFHLNQNTNMKAFKKKLFTHTDTIIEGKEMDLSV